MEWVLVLACQTALVRLLECKVQRHITLSAENQELMGIIRKKQDPVHHYTTVEFGLEEFNEDCGVGHQV